MQGEHLNSIVIVYFLFLSPLCEDAIGIVANVSEVK